MRPGVARLMTAKPVRDSPALAALVARGLRRPLRTTAPTADRTAASAAERQRRPAHRRSPDAGSAPRRPRRERARSFATRWINWDWRRPLHSSASSPDSPRARSPSSCAPTRPAPGSTRALARDKPGSRGTVAAIDLTLPRGAQAGGIVVTREQTYTDGRADLGGQRYRVYLVRLGAPQAGWEVSAWEPQP